MLYKGMTRFALVFLMFTWPLRACEVALVLALDVSRSVDRDEYVQMRDGIAAAFLDAEVVELITWVPGGIAVTVTQWGGDGQQRQVLGWRKLETTVDIERFIGDFVQQHRGYWMADTSVAEALIHADAMFANQPQTCRRQVIDVSGDGIANAGPDAAPYARAIGDKGVTINGLVVAGARPDPVAYFEDNVLAGPLPFIEVASSYQDYTRAMKRKLLREMTPVVSSLR